MARIKGASAPPKGGEHMKTQITLLLTTEMKEQAKKKAQSKGLDLSNYIRLLISEDLKK